LTDDELAEIERPSFTLLDGAHLERALFFRDAAGSVTPQLDAPTVRTPEQQAEALFAWVVRQIRLEDARDMDGDRPMMAPAMTLRRGVGPPLARALIFLGLLEQVGLDGCLLAYESKTSATWRYWACGVLGSGNKIYLFEPRLGIPLPGADGTGIATLDSLRADTEAVLRPLDFGPGQRLDLTAEAVAKSEVHLAVPLSAMAPRMRYLEQEHEVEDEKGKLKKVKVLPRGKPTWDPEAPRRFEQALKAAGHPQVVKLAPWAARLERNFLPEDEGGVDRLNLYQGVRLEPGYSHQGPFLAGLPRNIPLQQLNEPPFSGYFSRFSRRFFDFYYGPGQPRDLILRGDLGEAARALSAAESQNVLAYQHFRSNFDSSKVLEWVEEARSALARNTPFPQGGPGASMVVLLVEGSSAEAMLPELRYLLALVKHEQAERVLYRLGPPAGLTDTAQLRELDRVWREAQTLWAGFFSMDDPRPSDAILFQAKALQARCQHMLAEAALAQARRATPAERLNLEEQAQVAVDTALRYWQELAANRKDLAAVGYRFLARSLEKKAESKK
jgi:hypothetical protein